MSIYVPGLYPTCALSAWTSASKASMRADVVASGLHCTGPMMLTLMGWDGPPLLSTGQVMRAIYHILQGVPYVRKLTFIKLNEPVHDTIFYLYNFLIETSLYNIFP